MRNIRGEILNEKFCQIISDRQYQTKNFKRKTSNEKYLTKNIATPNEKYSTRQGKKRL